MQGFWAKVDQRGPDDCWEWQGHVHKVNGYGQLKYRGREYKAHRIAYDLTFGGVEWRTGRPGARGLLVLHKCDNRRCCNPHHLFVGTQKDNMSDCSRKGRIGHGDTHGHVKLTAENVAEIKRLEHEGRIGRAGRGWSHDVRSGKTMSLATVGKMFGVSGKTIEQVLRRRAWKGVGEPTPTRYP